MKEVIRFGSFSEKKINDILKRTFLSCGEKVVLLSQEFLGVPYRANTLLRENFKNEVLVVDFEGVDCMTFIEYVEALRLSNSFKGFLEALKKVRYKEGIISYEKRKHFFTDWILSNPHLMDVTSYLKKGAAITVRKKLNLKKDGSFLLPEIEPQERQIVYLPSKEIDITVMNALYSGDYIGFYTCEDGLDCSHTGIFVRKGEKLFLRHASSIFGKVVDEDFLTYSAQKDGIIVLRPV